jgi:putative restriction endonuclease
MALNPNEAFAEICRFCATYNRRAALSTNDAGTEAVREALENLRFWAERAFPSYNGIPLTVEVSEGSGNFPRVPWVAVLPPEQGVSNGVYFVVCFGREGAGAVAGCALR